jgi:hypothetical protein
MDSEQNISTLDNTNTFEDSINKDANHKNKNVKWDKLPKYTQWKLFKSFMHDNNLTDGNLFKRMKSMISEKKTNDFVTYDVNNQKVVHVDFKHEIFIRERSKKKKLQVQLAQSKEEDEVKKLEAAVNGLKIADENVEVLEEELCEIELN